MGPMATRLQVKWRRAIAIAIAFVTLAPYSFALVPLAGGEGETCGMSCCRRAKSCCCRKAKQSTPDALSSRWQAAPGCAAGCRQRANLPPIAPAITAAARPAIRAVAAHVTPLPALPVHDTAMCGAYALFERPPPRIF